MDWIKGVQRAVDYVEAHITEPINYVEVARQAYSSSFHFQRVFSILCGFTLGDYIRMRRLSLAGGELAASGALVIDVGINRGEDGKLYGDVDEPGLAGKAGRITPVPGGVGLMTRAMLMVNTLKAAKRQHGLG